MEIRHLAKKQSGTKRVIMGDVIRDILKGQPKATVEQVQSALRAQGVKASDALVKKIKYGRTNPPRSRVAGPAMVRTPAKQTPSAAHGASSGQMLVRAM